MRVYYALEAGADINKDGAAVFLRATSASMVPHFSQNGHLSEAGDLRDRRVRARGGRWKLH